MSMNEHYRLMLIKLPSTAAGEIRFASVRGDRGLFIKSPRHKASQCPVGGAVACSSCDQCET